MTKSWKTRTNPYMAKIFPLTGQSQLSTCSHLANIAVIRKKPVLAGQFFRPLPVLRTSSPHFPRAFAAFGGHIAGAPFSLRLSKPSHVSREGPNVTEKAMTVAAVGGASSLSQLYNAQQAQALSAVTVDSPAASTPDGSTTTSNTDSSNSLTGLTTSNLDSQTLQALLDLTQTDPSNPSSDPSQAGQTTGQTGQAQGAHHHHHHHGGGGCRPKIRPTIRRSLPRQQRAAPRLTPRRMRRMHRWSWRCRMLETEAPRKRGF